MTDHNSYNVLFLCTGNSARSIIAESVLNRLGKGRFAAYSAGSHPSGQIHPLTAELLSRLDYNLDDARSKSWDEFATDDAPQMDLIFTVCDNAAGEVCPIWPGHPATAHWPFLDPAAFEGSEADHRALFVKVYGMIERRIEAFIKLPIDEMDKSTLQKRLNEMEQETPASTK
ncbi:MAG: arsenate reductase ArsC [Alphaproteobacteria bacterium]|nr:arsenate reductase ArsC [Alphaproteobacteria bacterium]